MSALELAPLRAARIEGVLVGTVIGLFLGIAIMLAAYAVPS